MRSTTGFVITRHRGFHITFENGWTASVQWGPGNYCDNYDVMDFDAPRNASASWESSTAEVAAWPPSGDFVAFDSGDIVMGRLTPAEVLSFLNEIACKEVVSLMTTTQAG